jgi:mono/diheme cytochrome c family protein
MRVVVRFVRLVSAAAAFSVGLFTLAATAQQQAGGAPNPNTAKMKNPVAATPASVAAGKKLYDGQCASCHGAAGKGDGKAGALLKPVPSDLTDGDWKHGQSDGQIFAIIRDGAKQSGMRGYGSRIPANDIWNLVNYVRSLGPKTTKSH